MNSKFVHVLFMFVHVFAVGSGICLDNTGIS